MKMTTLYWGYISFYDKLTRKKFMYGMRQQPHYASTLLFKIGSLSPCHHHKSDGPLAWWFHMVYPRHKAHILMSSSYLIFTNRNQFMDPNLIISHTNKPFNHHILFCKSIINKYPHTPPSDPKLLLHLIVNTFIQRPRIMSLKNQLHDVVYITFLPKHKQPILDSNS